jgi:Uma2 family endonuclease
MNTEQQITTPEAFDAYAQLAVNTGRRLEFIKGSVYEVPPYPEHAVLIQRIGQHITAYARLNSDGRWQGSLMGYAFGEERYQPDASFIAEEREGWQAGAAWQPFPPDLAIEVVSPAHSVIAIREKIREYVRAGVILWVVYPLSQEVDVYMPDQYPQNFTLDDVLEGAWVLPDFLLAVSDIFAE